MWFVFGVVLAAVAVGQEEKQSDNRVGGVAVTVPPGDDADLLLKTMIELTVDHNSGYVLDRLANCHLSAAQVKQLIEAADREDSDSKRVLLWQAIRMSSDTNGRSYLIRTLLEKNSVELQIQFIEGLRNPTRFDIPILVALYNSHRPRKEEVDSSAVSSTSTEYEKVQNSKKQKSAKEPAWQSQPRSLNRDKKRYESSDSGIPAPESSSEDEAKDNERDTKQEVDGKQASAEAHLDVGDVLDVPQKIVELTCHFDWDRNFVVSPGFPLHHDGSDPPELKKKSEGLFRQKGIEADFAQRKMILWLVRNGFEESHRVGAFEKYLSSKHASDTATIRTDYGDELLKGLNEPESRARAVRLVGLSVALGRFLLADEAEVVKLSAIDAMTKEIMDTRSSMSNVSFRNLASQYKPALERAQGFDSSPKVKASASRLLETIVEYEKIDAKRPDGGLR